VGQRLSRTDLLSAASRPPRLVAAGLSDIAKFYRQMGSYKPGFILNKLFVDDVDTVSRWGWMPFVASGLRSSQLLLLWRAVDREGRMHRESSQKRNGTREKFPAIIKWPYLWCAIKEKTYNQRYNQSNVKLYILLDRLYIGNLWEPPHDIQVDVHTPPGLHILFGVYALPDVHILLSLYTLLGSYTLLSLYTPPGLHTLFGVYALPGVYTLLGSYTLLSLHTPPCLYTLFGMYALPGVYTLDFLGAYKEWVNMLSMTDH
jgi:hypothetical protein